MNLHRLDLISLSLFDLVANAGSISKGAEQAHLAVGAASRRLSELEAALSTPLLERHSRGVVLTAAGMALQRHAELILNNVRQLDAELSDYARGIVGSVRLWTNTAALGQGLPKKLAAFEARHAIQVDFQEHDSTEVALGLLDGRAELGILAEGTPLLGLQTVEYSQDRLVLAVSSEHPLASRGSIGFEEATAFAFVSLGLNASLSRRLALYANQLGTSIRIRFHVRSYDAMWHMVGAGLGIAMLPRSAAKPFCGTEGVRILSITDAWAQRHLLIAARDLNGLPRAAHSLYEHLRRNISDQQLADST